MTYGFKIVNYTTQWWRATSLPLFIHAVSPELFRVTNYIRSSHLFPLACLGMWSFYLLPHFISITLNGITFSTVVQILSTPRKREKFFPLPILGSLLGVLYIRLIKDWQEKNKQKFINIRNAHKCGSTGWWVRGGWKLGFVLS